MLMSAVAVVVVCALTLDASGNGGGTVGGGSCSVARPAANAIAIKAVAGVTILNAYLLGDVPGTLLGNPVNIDLTLRVRKGDDDNAVFQAFRLELQNIDITSFLSNEALACLFLDPGLPSTNPNFDAVNGFVQAIAQFLGLKRPVTRFVITNRSIRNTEPVPGHDQQVCLAVTLDPVTRVPTCVGPAGSTNASAIADIVFYTR